MRMITGGFGRRLRYRDGCCLSQGDGRLSLTAAGGEEVHPRLQDRPIREPSVAHQNQPSRSSRSIRASLRSATASLSSFRIIVRGVVMEAIRPALTTLRVSAPRRVPRALYQCLHTSTSRWAQPLPQPSVPGPPPEAPTPSASDALDRVARKRKQAELLKQAQEVKTSPSKPKSVLQKRFWKDVSVQETEGKSIN